MFELAPAFAFAELAFAITLVLATANSLRKHHRGFAWWTALVATCVIGLGVGAWSGFAFSYQPTPHLIVDGFPVPSAFHVLETYTNGSSRWTNLITPAPFLSAIGNAFLFLGLTVVPVWLINVLAVRKRQIRSAL